MVEYAGAGTLGSAKENWVEGGEVGVVGDQGDPTPDAGEGSEFWCGRPEGVWFSVSWQSLLNAIRLLRRRHFPEPIDDSSNVISVTGFVTMVIELMT